LILMIAPRPSRRTLLALLTSVGAVSAGGIYFWRIVPDVLIAKILSRRLPGVRIDAVSIAALSGDVQRDRFHSFPRRLALESGALAANIVGIDALAQFKPTATQFAQLERVVITLFILGSDYLNVKDPKLDLVTYSAIPQVCPNPFAQYD
jgi:hypothetical protein